MPKSEDGLKWWLRYVIVPVLGSGGLVAIVVALIGRLPGPGPVPSPQPLPVPAVVPQRGPVNQVPKSPDIQRCRYFAFDVASADTYPTDVEIEDFKRSAESNDFHGLVAVLKGYGTKPVRLRMTGRWRAGTWAFPGEGYADIEYAPYMQVRIESASQIAVDVAERTTLFPRLAKIGVSESVACQRSPEGVTWLLAKSGNR